MEMSGQLERGGDNFEIEDVVGMDFFSPEREMSMRAYEGMEKRILVKWKGVDMNPRSPGYRGPYPIDRIPLSDCNAATKKAASKYEQGWELSDTTQVLGHEVHRSGRHTWYYIKWTQGDGTVVQKWVPKRCLRHPISKNGLVGPYEKKLEEAKKEAAEARSAQERAAKRAERKRDAEELQRAGAGAPLEQQLAAAGVSIPSATSAAAVNMQPLQGELARLMPAQAIAAQGERAAIRAATRERHALAGHAQPAVGVLQQQHTEAGETTFDTRGAVSSNSRLKKKRRSKSREVMETSGTRISGMGTFMTLPGRSAAQQAAGKGETGDGLVDTDEED